MEYHMQASKTKQKTDDNLQLGIELVSEFYVLKFYDTALEVEEIDDLCFFQIPLDLDQVEKLRKGVPIFQTCYAGEVNISFSMYNVVIHLKPKSWPFGDTIYVSLSEFKEALKSNEV